MATIVIYFVIQKIPQLKISSFSAKYSVKRSYKFFQNKIKYNSFRTKFMVKIRMEFYLLLVILFPLFYLQHIVKNPFFHARTHERFWRVLNAALFALHFACNQQSL